MAVAAALGSLAVVAPAYASSADITLSQSSFDMSPGDSKQLTVRLENTTEVPNPSASVTVNAPGELGDIQVKSSDANCNGSGGSVTCSSPVEAKKSKDFVVTLTAKNPGSLQPGGSKPGTGSVQVAFGGQKPFNITLHGPQPTQPTEAPTVAQITGTVKDSTTGAAVKNALVALSDSGACTPRSPCQAGTDNQGVFKFTPSAGKPITPGTLQLGAVKSGYDTLVKTVQAQAGQSVTITFSLKPTAVASASASAEPLPSAEGQAPSADAGASAPAADTQKRASNSSTSPLSWVILVLAALLVLAGVGVFVMMFLNRRKRDDDGDGDGDGEDGNNPPTAPGGAPVASGPGMYGAGDPTMVGRPGMMPAGMAMPGASDATAILRPMRPEDEFPDPYAAPYPTNMPGYPPTGGYGAATQVGAYPPPGQPAGYDPTMQQGYGGAPAGYGGQPGQGYGGEPGYGGQPGQGYGGQPGQGYGREPGYGAPNGAAPRYDEATGHWDGEAEGYPATGVHSQQGGYDQQQRAGYDQQQGAGYDQQQGAGYDQQQGAGYDERGGYDAAGYPPAQDPYYQEEPPPPVAPTPPGSARRGTPPAGRGGDRQQLNWLDD